jgi:hypothetical protein
MLTIEKDTMYLKAVRPEMFGSVFRPKFKLWSMFQAAVVGNGAGLNFERKPTQTKTKI